MSTNNPYDERDICTGVANDSIHQLNKLDKSLGNRKRRRIYPLTYIQAVFDAKSGTRLDAILDMVNSVYLPWKGTARATRIQVPFKVRRKGLMISYRNIDNEIITEKCITDECVKDDIFGLDSSWVLITDALPISGNVTIGSNGNWFVDGEDTGFKAQGPKGENGVPLQPRLSEDKTKIEYSLDGEVWQELFPLDLVTPTIEFSEPVGLEPGSTPTVTNIGDDYNVNLQLGLPKAPSVSVGSTTTIGEGNQAKVTNSGTPYAPVLNFQIPKGDTGRGITIKGFYPDLSTLQEKVTAPAIGDVYCVGSAEPYEGYVWTNVYSSESQSSSPAWQPLGQINKDTTVIVNDLGDREDVAMSQKGVTMNYNYLAQNASAYELPIVISNFLCNISEDGNFTGYIYDENFDSVRLRILEGAKIIRLSGAVNLSICYFSDLDATTESFIRRDIEFKEIPNEAKLCVINFKKEENTNGYKDLRIYQEGAYINSKTIKDNNTIINSLASTLGLNARSRNLINKDDLLYDYYTENGLWVNKVGAISSGKLYLREGVRYVIGGLKAYINSNSNFIAEFDALDNYLGRFGIPYISNSDFTGIFSYHKKENTSYCRLILKDTDSEETDFSKVQLTELFILEDPTFKGYDFENFNMYEKEFCNSLSNIFIEKPIGKNYINIYDLLYGYTINSGEIIEQSRGILSNKLFLEHGKTYTISGISIYNPTVSVDNVYIAHYNKNGEFIKRTRHLRTPYPDSIYGDCTFTFDNSDNNTFYVRVLLQNLSYESVFNPSIIQLEEGSTKTEHEFYKGTNRSIPEVTQTIKVFNKNILLTGASFAYPENEWFSSLCNSLNVTGYNKAVSGETIVDTAQKMYDETLYTSDEFEDFEILLIFHSHNQKVTNTTYIKENYEEYQFPLTDKSACWDYVLKKYASECYAAKDNPESKWYGTKYGKPFVVVVCTHWHDARTIFNDSIRELQKKWGFTLCELDKNIGFSKNQVHPVTKEQISILHCDNGYGNTEEIEGVTYGWHPTRGKNAWIQYKIASIIKSTLYTL